MSDTNTAPKKPHRRLSHPEYFKLRQWTEENAEMVADMTNVKHANLASTALGFECSDVSIAGLRKDLGIVRPEPEKQLELPEILLVVNGLAEVVASMQIRIARLEQQAEPVVTNYPAHREPADEPSLSLD